MHAGCVDSSHTNGSIDAFGVVCFWIYFHAAQPLLLLTRVSHSGIVMSTSAPCKIVCLMMSRFLIMGFVGCVIAVLLRNQNWTGSSCPAPFVACACPNQGKFHNMAVSIGATNKDHTYNSVLSQIDCKRRAII